MIAGDDTPRNMLTSEFPHSGLISAYWTVVLRYSRKGDRNFGSSRRRG
jgi:hypothetical protein